ncbi:MAG: phage head-tail connector protein [Clostridium sp.]|uniref:phage head-tail connector protein n=1 Tax=Clostridium sp. TaxID=1506 RepID=UPI00305992DF
MKKEQIDSILKSVKLRPGMSSLREELIIEFIEDTFNDVAEYINLELGVDMPIGCISIVKDLVIIKANKLGSEGISSDSHEGVSQSYIDGIPKDIKARLRRYRRLPI